MAEEGAGADRGGRQQLGRERWKWRSDVRVRERSGYAVLERMRAEWALVQGVHK